MDTTAAKLRWRVAIAALIGVFALALAVPQLAMAYTASGTCGENATYEYDSSTHTLTISGTGAMGDGGAYGSMDLTSFADGCETVIVNEGITHIGTYSFEIYSTLKNVTLPNSLESIGKGGFHGAAIESITLPEGLKTIGAETFFQCSDLETVSIPASVTQIGRSAFAFCPKLQSLALDPANSSFKSSNGVLYSADKKTLIAYPAASPATSYAVSKKTVELADGAFSDANKLKTLDLGGVKILAADVFANCTSLKSLSMPKVVKIKSGAFLGCEKLRTLTIPKTTTNIGSFAFFSCTNLVSFKVAADNKHFSAKDGVLFNKKKTALVAYPIAKTGKTYTVPNSVTVLKDCAFLDSANLVKVTLGTNIKRIGDLSLDGVMLSKITIKSKKVTDIGSSLAGYERTFRVPASKKADYKWRLKEADYNIKSITAL